MSWDSEKKVRKKRRWGKVFEYTSYQRKVPYGEALEDLYSKIEQDVKKTRIITPQELAAKHDVRVSYVKTILGELEEKGVIKKFVGNAKFRTYVPMGKE
jgi:ribosomal protein S25